MSIANRIEKIRFLVQEIELANRIALAQPTDYLKRASARRVIVRVKDFVSHISQLPKPLKAAGFNSSELKDRKELYAKEFTAYYQKQRDRIGAHVQDIGLIERLELWTDIEVTKLSYFVDGARELYATSLGAIGVPDYQPFASFAELSDPGFAAALVAHADAIPTPSGVTADVGSFALSNPNTIATIECAPLQQRASQLVTLREWVQISAGLHERIASWRNAERLIRAQLLTDAVSFADCLVTRFDAGVAQQMTGLDDLVREAKGDASAIEDLLRVFLFKDKLAELRAVRNIVGGHFDDDEDTSLIDLLNKLDGMSMTEILRFYSKLSASFDLTCRRTFFLGQYIRNGVRIAGAVASTGAREYVRPFAQGSEVESESAETEGVRGDYSDDAIERAFDAAVSGEPWGRDILWDAFGAAPIVERCETGSRFFEFRTPHKKLLARICAASVDKRVRLFALVESCASGWPEPLAEVLLRCLDVLGGRGDHESDAAIYNALGVLPLAQPQRVYDQLIKGAGSADPASARAALVALYRLVVHGALRSNSWSATGFAANIQSLLDARPTEERLLVALVIASLYPAGEFHVSEKNAEREMGAIQPALRSYLGNTGDDSIEEKALAVHDYVGLAVCAARRFNGTKRDAEGKAILDAVVRGEIVLPADFDRRAAPLTSLALACIDIGEHERAKRIACEVMAAHPADIALKLHCLLLLLVAGADPNVCGEMLDYICDAYVLDTSLKAQAEGVARAITARSVSVSQDSSSRS